jgi:hypothetical protein
LRFNKAHKERRGDGFLEIIHRTHLHRLHVSAQIGATPQNPREEAFRSEEFRVAQSSPLLAQKNAATHQRFFAWWLGDPKVGILILSRRRTMTPLFTPAVKRAGHLSS